jgi:hypothetical protein
MMKALQFIGYSALGFGVIAGALLGTELVSNAMGKEKKE